MLRTSAVKGIGLDPNEEIGQRQALTGIMPVQTNTSSGPSFGNKGPA